MENRKINPEDYDDPMELVKDSIYFYTEGEGQEEFANHNTLVLTSGEVDDQRGMAGAV